MAFDRVLWRMHHERLVVKLEAMVPSVEKALADASMKGAQDVAAYARALLRGNSRSGGTGALAASIVAEAVPERLGARVAAGGTAGTRKLVREGAAAYADDADFGGGSKYVDTAFMKEFGTKRHRNKGKFAGSRHPGTKAEPFFYPAAKLNKARNKRRMSQALSQAMKAAK